MAADGGALHQFGNILLGGRGGMNPGQLKIHPGGFVWKKTGGGKVVDVSKADISALTWTRLPKGYQLAVKMRAGSNVKFSGFREQDVASLNPFLDANLGITPEDKPLAISGRSWGEAELDGNMLSFVVGGKQAFEVSIADVSQTQMMGKNDVVLEFHVDDTTGANEKDTLMELSFHVPSTNGTYIGDEERPSAQVFREKILSMADVGPSGAEAIAMFVEVGILTPRGRYNVELHLSFLRLQGQANDFKIQYNSVVRLFILPKSNQPHTFVVITLDPPIRKGQTFYPHIVLQFPSEEITECSLSIQEDLLTTKYKDRLQPHYKDLSHDVFTQILKGLSGAKVTRPGKFRSSQDGYAVRASLKAEEGTLYPLEKSFFFLPKPPTLVLHDEIEFVEFERHGTAGPSSISSHYFDLLIRLKSEQEHQFRNIQRNEYHNLFDFISSKGLKILNLGDNSQGASGVAAALEASDDEGVDPHLNRIRSARGDGGVGGGDDSDEEESSLVGKRGEQMAKSEKLLNAQTQLLSLHMRLQLTFHLLALDEDFVAEKDDAGSPTDDSEAEEPDASDDDVGGGSEEDEDEEEEEEDERPKKKKREPVAAKPRKRKPKEDADGGKKSKRKKKDPNAPKRGLSGFMYFSQSERENLKKSQPGLSFTETGKVLGDKWKKMSGEEKTPFEAKARADKERYKRDMDEFNRGGAAQVEDNGSDEE